MFPSSTPTGRTPRAGRSLNIGTPSSIQKKQPPTPSTSSTHGLLNEQHRPAIEAPSPVPSPALIKPEKFKIEQTDRHLVELYSSLPPIVKAAVEAEDVVEVSAKIDDFGYCAVVVDQRVWCWQYALGQTTSKVGQFNIPNSAFSGSASLVCTVPLPESRTVPRGLSAGLLVCTREGTFAYYENGAKIAETSLALTNDLATKLVQCENTGFILGTKRGALYQIMINKSSVQVVIQARCLQQPPTSSMLAGLGRMLWGSAAKVSNSVRSLIPSQSHLFVLTENHLQKWNLSPASEGLLYEISLLNMVQQQLKWDEEKENGISVDLKVWLLDVQPVGEELYILVASTPKFVPEDGIGLLTYSIMELLGTGGAQVSLGEGFSLHYQPRYIESEEYYLIDSVRLLIPTGSSGAYVFSPYFIVLTKVPTDDRPLDLINFQPYNDRVLGSGCLGMKALFVSEKRGVIAVSQGLPSTEPMHAKKATPMETEIGAHSIQDVQERRKQFEDAFYKYCRGDNTSLRIAKELIPRSEEEMNNLMTTIGALIIDSSPRNDPRWAEEKHVNSATSSLLIQHQLAEKKTRHSTYRQFLSDLGMDQYLSQNASTKISIQSEKLDAAIQLRALQNSNQMKQQSMILQAMKRYAQGKEVGNLSATDVFYSKVSQVDAILGHIQRVLVEEFKATDVVLEKRCHDLYESNSVFLAVLGAFSAKTIYMANKPVVLRDVIQNQFKHTLEFINELSGAPSSERGQVASWIDDFFNQLAELTEHLLQAYREEWLAYRSQLDMEEATEQVLKKKYMAVRDQHLEPFVQMRRELATRLADKFMAFPALFQIYDKYEDTEMLHYWMNKFKLDGFIHYVFSQFMEQNMTHLIFSQPKSFDSDVAKFLKAYPQLSWIHAIRTEKFEEAANTLFHVGRQQIDFPDKKTFFSLSKLAAVVAGESPEMEEIKRMDSQMLYLINSQEIELQERHFGPDSIKTGLHVWEEHNIDRQSMHLSPEFEARNPNYMIQLFLNKHPSDLRVMDFMKALDLWANVDIFVENKEQTLLDIWSKAFNVHPWSSLAADWNNGYLDDTTVVDTIKKTVFFQLATEPRAQDTLRGQPALLPTIFQNYAKSSPQEGTLVSLLETIQTLLKQNNQQGVIA